MLSSDDDDEDDKLWRSHLFVTGKDKVIPSDRSSQGNVPPEDDGVVGKKIV